VLKPAKKKRWAAASANDRRLPAKERAELARERHAALASYA
jgi:hypothetical protein